MLRKASRYETMNEEELKKLIETWQILYLPFVSEMDEAALKITKKGLVLFAEESGMSASQYLLMLADSLNDVIAFLAKGNTLEELNDKF